MLEVTLWASGVVHVSVLLSRESTELDCHCYRQAQGAKGLPIISGEILRILSFHGITSP